MPLLPELVLIGGAFALLMLDLFLDAQAPRHDPCAGAGAAGRGVLAMIAGAGGHGTVFSGMFVRDVMADVQQDR